MRLFALSLLAVMLCPVSRATEAPESPGPIGRALVRMYNFDFPGAQRILDDHIGRNPSDPLGYAMRAASLLFSELDRLMILESEFFVDDRRIANRNRLSPDPAIRARLFKAVEQAQSRARGVLASHPDDPEALFALCMATGVLTDYTGLVEKRKLASFAYARQSHVYALELLRRHPAFYDAYLTKGLSEYLIGSLPFFVRWFVHFDEVEGSKTQAVRNLELVASSGRYLGPFARILLAIIHLREKRPGESEKLLAGLARDYPENQLFRRELAKLTENRQPPAAGH